MAFFARFSRSTPNIGVIWWRIPSGFRARSRNCCADYSIPTVGRVLTEDVTLDGVTLKAGDYVQLTTCFHGLDDRKWTDPLAVDFHRSGLSEHMAFGRGVHKCPGANLARSELRVFLRSG